MSTSSLVRDQTIGRWVLSEWSITRGWTLHGSAGVAHQFPEFEQVLGTANAPDVKPERATHIDIGIEQRLGRLIRWQATLYSREERDILRAPDSIPSQEEGLFAQRSTSGHYENALTGSAHGAELLLERRTMTGLSGWVAYSYGRTRYHDAARSEMFSGDFDQRHAINAVGLWRTAHGTNVAVTFRGGTNFPIPGYLEARDGGLFLGSQRNEVRLPTYVRLDVRADRTFTCLGRRVTVFGEILNVLNRTNLGLADGVIEPRTGRAVGFTEALIQRLPSAGVQIEF